MIDIADVLGRDGDPLAIGPLQVETILVGADELALGVQVTTQRHARAVTARRESEEWQDGRCDRL
jgi:hypothetical protein